MAKNTKVKKEVVIVRKPQLVEQLAEKLNISKAKAGESFDAQIAIIQENLVAGNKVQILGFGDFEVTERAARIGTNPKTKEKIKIAASKYPKFKAGKTLKDAVNGGKKAKTEAVAETSASKTIASVKPAGNKNTKTTATPPAATGKNGNKGNKGGKKK